MNTILPLFLAVLILTIGLAAYFLVLGALFASRVTKTQGAIAQSRGRAFWVGLVNFLFFGVIALALYAIGENAGSGLRTVLMIPSLFITAALLFLLGLGLTGMVNILGERVFPDQSAWKKTVLGTVILAFACAVPVAGWFLLLPYTGLIGFGAVILSFFQRETK
jgi:hypothetical protein